MSFRNQARERAIQMLLEEYQPILNNFNISLTEGDLKELFRRFEEEKGWKTFLPRREVEEYLKEKYSEYFELDKLNWFLKKDGIDDLNIKFIESLGMEPIKKKKTKGYSLLTLWVEFQGEKRLLDEWIKIYKETPPTGLLQAAAKANDERFGLKFDGDLSGIKSYFNTAKGISEAQLDERVKEAKQSIQAKESLKTVILAMERDEVAFLHDHIIQSLHCEMVKEAKKLDVYQEDSDFLWIKYLVKNYEELKNGKLTEEKYNSFLKKFKYYVENWETL